MAPPDNLDRLLEQIQFPGMPMPESDVFREWLVRHGKEYDRIDFQVRLGEGVKLGSEVSPETAALANMMTQKRADAFVWRADQSTIIEVKIRASLGAMGQLLGYRALYVAANPAAPVPLLLVIARRMDDDTKSVLDGHGIDVILYVD